MFGGAARSLVLREVVDHEADENNRTNNEKDRPDEDDD
jgi:hypothetical protein